MGQVKEWSRMDKLEIHRKGVGMEQIPYIVYEQAEVRHERTIKRLIVALIIAIIAIVASNGAWLYCWMQYDYATESVELDTTQGGNANYIGGDNIQGDINNGTN